MIWVPMSRSRLTISVPTGSRIIYLAEFETPLSYPLGFVIPPSQTFDDTFYKNVPPHLKSVKLMSE